MIVHETLLSTVTSRRVTCLSTYLLHGDNGVGGRLLYLEDVEATANGTLLVLHLRQLALHVIDILHSLVGWGRGGVREGSKDTRNGERRVTER